MSSHEASKALASQEEKPLNQYQVKNLREIIEGDYADLYSSLTTDIQNRLSRKKDEIKERFKDVADLEAARAKLVKAKEKAERDLQKVIDEVTNADGSITVKSGMHRSQRVYLVDVSPECLEQTGLDDEIEKAEEASRRLMRVLKTTLDRERRSAVRSVLMQSLTGVGAAELIEDVPTKDELLQMVSEELARKNLDDLNMLLTDEEIEQAQSLLEVE